MPSKARKYTYAESLTLSTTTTASDQTKVTLTFTPDASSTYVYIWNADIQATTGTTYDNIVTLKNNAGTTLSTSNFESKDTTDFATISGIAFETFGASPTSQSVTLTYRTETATNSVGIKNARIVAIKLTAADAYVENTADSSTTGTSLSTATTLTFTPATTGNYLILGSAETRSSSTTVTVNSQITYSGTGYSIAAARSNDITNYVSGLMQASVGSLTATSKSITLQFSSGSAGTTVNCRRARLLALRLDEFSDSSITTDTSSTSTTSLTYATKTTTDTTVSPELSYLVIGTAAIGPSTGSPTTISSGYGFSVGGTYSSESLVESVSNGNYPSASFGSFTVVSTSSTTLTSQFNYYSETASVTTVADDVTISVLLLDPTDLYWVGGTGTWNNSSSTNWATTSGGTANAGVPKAGTNVYFDAASDSGTGFTVTVSTGAVCKDLTVSGLDQTMTLSGSSAWSVYGNFSVPATNFTQSYTGTITFASTSTKTITTNGKSFTAFTFDGVGGTWTLQDAATITGAATLTNGTFALGSYTFTCDTFASNNSNVRTINFGTGKIVITSASTATVWNTSTITNLTVSGTALLELTGGGATTKTVTLGALSEANSISVTLNTTAGTVALTGSVNDLILANNSFTLGNGARTIYGSFTINGSNPTLTAGTSVTTFAATSGTKIITTNGKTIDFPLTFNGAGGTWRLGGALTVGTSTSRAITMTSGTFDLYGYDFTLYGTWDQSAGGMTFNNTGGTTNRIILTLDTTATVFNGNIGAPANPTDGNVTVRVLGSNAATSRTYFPARASGDRSASVMNWEIAATAGTINIGTLASGQAYNNLTIENNNITVYFPGPQMCHGNFTVNGTNPTISYPPTGSSQIFYFAGTNGTQTINLNGNASNTIDCDVYFNYYGTGTVQLTHNLNIGVAISRTVSLGQGTLDLNEYNLTIYGGFTSTNTNTRTVDFGSVSKIIMTLSGITVWNTSSATNLSILGTNPLIQLTGTGGTAAFSMNNAGATESNSFSIQLSSATTTTATITGSIRDLTIDNYDITLNNNPRTIYGSLTVGGTTPVLTAGTSVMTFAATSGTKTINLNGNNSNTLDFPITFNGVGGTWQLQHALNVGTATSRTVTLTNGTLDLNNYTFTIYGIFSSSNSNARTIAFGSSGKIVLSLAGATATTIWNMITATNFTVSGTPLVEVTDSGTLIRTIAAGSTNPAGESGAVSFSILTSAGTTTFSAGGQVKTLILNCSGTTVNLGSTTGLTFYGSLTNTASTLNTVGTSIFAATSGTNTIDTGGATFNDITINGVGGTFVLANNLNLGANDLILTNGTFDASSYNVTAGGLQSDNTNTRTLNMGSGTWTLSNGGGTRNTAPWNINDGGTGLTLNKQNANIVLSYNSTGVTEFYGGGKTYNNVTFSGTSTGLCRIYGSNTFATLSIPNNRGRDLYLESGSTNTVTTFDVYGESGDTMLLYAITAGSQATLAYSGSSKQTVAYAVFRDIIGYPEQTWYGGTTSTDNGNNLNIYFRDPEPFYNAGNGPSVWFAVI